MRWAVFFRNVNQGQRGHPTTRHLADALVAAGFVDPRGFQSNGTFVADGPDAAPDALPAAVARLSARTRRPEAAFALPLDNVIERVTGFAGDRDRVEFSAFAGTLTLDAPFRGTDCTVVSAGEGWAFTRNDADGAGNATRSLERVLGAPATSRGMPTMLRLVARHGPSE